MVVVKSLVVSGRIPAGRAGIARTYKGVDVTLRCWPPGVSNKWPRGSCDQVVKPKML